MFGPAANAAQAADHEAIACRAERSPNIGSDVTRSFGVFIDGDATTALIAGV